MHRRVSGTLKRPAGPLRGRARPTARTTRSCCCGCSTRWSTARSSCTASTSSTLDDAAQAAFWDDYKVVGRLFGLRKRGHAARHSTDCEPTVDEMLGGDTLHVTDWARTRAREIVLEPPVPLAARPLVEAVNFITIALLPERIRREYGFLPAAAGVDAARARERRRRVREARRDPVPARAAALRAGRASGLDAVQRPRARARAAACP